MAIVHSVGYSPANAIHETALESGLVNKYGGFGGSNDVPQSPAQRLQSGGTVQGWRLVQSSWNIWREPAN